MTNGLSTNAEKKLLLFDSHALAFSQLVHQLPNEVMAGFFRMVNGAIQRHEPAHLIVTFDPPPPTFRHGLYPDYKANRPPAPEGLLEDCDRVRDRLGSMDVALEDYEADDVLGTLSTRAAASGFKTVIMTSDLDLLQLVNPVTEVEVFSQYWETRFFDVETTEWRYGGLAPENIPDYKALVGDRSDNLPGVPGIGDVSATAVLEKYGSLEDVYADLDGVSQLPTRGARRVSKLLAQHRDQAFLMRTLTTIVREVPVDMDINGATIEGSGLDTVEVMTA